MSKVIMFSTVFPAYHPRKGEPTYFVEKIWKGLYDNEPSGYIPFEWQAYDEAFPTGDKYDENLNIHIHLPKFHTIRNGNRWKVGDKFSPRVWSGKPYRTKQVIIAPDIEIKKLWTFISNGDYFFIGNKQVDVTSSDIPQNDGLSSDDFLDWFPVENKIKELQIICWNENIQYP